MNLICFALVIVGISSLAGCTSTPTPVPFAPTPGKSYQSLGELPGLERVVQLSDHAFRGAQPEGPKGMETLRSLGIRSIIGVDPSEEERRFAEAAGLAYHVVPLNYSGWTDSQAEEILTILQEAPKPIYIHCHHGKHRAGSVSVIYRIGIQGWKNQPAVRELETLGCSTRYIGIYERARSWQPVRKSKGESLE